MVFAHKFTACYLKRVTQLKLSAAQSMVDKNSVILVADTIVSIDRLILMKPKSYEEYKKLCAYYHRIGIRFTQDSCWLIEQYSSCINDKK